MVLACGTRPCEAPLGLLKGMLSWESLQELKSSGGGGTLYCPLPEAGGQVGEVPEAVSREWLPGPPRGRRWFSFPRKEYCRCLREPTRLLNGAVAPAGMHCIPDCERAASPGKQAKTGGGRG